MEMEMENKNIEPGLYKVVVIDESQILPNKLSFQVTEGKYKGVVIRIPKQESQKKECLTTEELHLVF
jgi:hypothetical protein